MWLHRWWPPQLHLLCTTTTRGRELGALTTAVWTTVTFSFMTMVNWCRSVPTTVRKVYVCSGATHANAAAGLAPCVHPKFWASLYSIPSCLKKLRSWSFITTVYLLNTRDGRECAKENGLLFDTRKPTLLGACCIRLCFQALAYDCRGVQRAILICQVAARLLYAYSWTTAAG